MSVKVVAEIMQKKVHSFYPHLKPEQSSDAMGLSHLKFMLKEIIEKPMPSDKVNRWLGYAQSLAIFHGIYHFEELSEINKEHLNA